MRHSVSIGSFGYHSAYDTVYISLLYFTFTSTDDDIYHRWA